MWHRESHLIRHKTVPVAFNVAIDMIPEALLVHLSPLKWEHINLTGDYNWRRDGGLRNRKLRPLRTAFAPPANLP